MKNNAINIGDLMPVLQIINQGILITDNQGLIIFFNESQARMDGFSYKEIIGKKVTDAYETAEDSSLFMKCIKKNNPLSMSV